MADLANFFRPAAAWAARLLLAMMMMTMVGRQKPSKRW
jgi:hypothetical protein